MVNKPRPGAGRTDDSEIRFSVLLLYYVRVRSTDQGSLRMILTHFIP